MSDTFKCSLQEILEAMVAVCLEFIGDRAQVVYLHCSTEQGVSSANVFYDINGALCRTHELNLPEAGTGTTEAGTSDARLSSLLESLLDDLDRLIELHENNGQEPPTEVKLRYDVVRMSLSASYSYDLKFSNSDTLLPSDIFDAWHEEVKSQRPRAD
ncbi:MULTISPECIES: hypothetical protein [unclassified Stenotrophomonas]|uniref:hypothetical protein n=1 Tax=unclassified Stenotrophomonas TaxID=196198 RepID=UPI000D16BA17|nr:MULTISPECIES: hypothetical protein [unclassified Stenotrophomonas]PTA72654.1 hypothetical protein C9412_04135 [Stenotrophomonas sp. Nf1]PTA75888.1 hypothetical protein C9416_18375 [Stenotrophomonas sp. Nf4]